MIRASLLIALALLVVGCATQTLVPQSNLEFFPASYSQTPGTTAFSVPDSDRTIYISDEPIITHKDILKAKETRDAHGALAISLTLTEQAGERMYEYTRNHLSEPIAICLDGELLSAPTVQSAIRTHSQITGGVEGLSKEQVQKILNAVHAR